MADIKTTKEGRVNIPLGPAKLKELAQLAKRYKVSKGGLGRAIILDGMERIKSGQLDVSAGIEITSKH